MTPIMVLHLTGLILLMTVLVVVLHELGHAIAAKLCGWTCVGFGALGVFIPWDKGVSLKSPMPRFGLAYVTGLCVAFPKDFETDKRWHYPAYVAGGLIANGILILGTAIVAWSMESWVVAALLIQPIAHTLFTLFPARGALISDGTKLRYLVTPGRAQTRERLRFLTETALLCGTRPVLSESDYAILMSSRDISVQYLGYGYRLLQAREENDTDMIDELKSGLDTLARIYTHTFSSDPLEIFTTEPVPVN